VRKRADHEPGYVLHTYAYKETSLIVEAFTRRFGRVAMLARGARRPRSAMRGVLLSFHPLRLSWSGASELANLIGAEWAGGTRHLGGRALMCGFYLNELLLRLLPRDDAHEALFDAYAQALAALASQDISAVLRAFEKRLLAELGYAPLLDRRTAARCRPTGRGAASVRVSFLSAARRCSTSRPAISRGPRPATRRAASCAR